jgi:hypothetical protein
MQPPEISALKAELKEAEALFHVANLLVGADEEQDRMFIKALTGYRELRGQLVNAIEKCAVAAGGVIRLEMGRAESKST